jgi:hypothetical protein
MFVLSGGFCESTEDDSQVFKTNRQTDLKPQACSRIMPVAQFVWVFHFVEREVLLFFSSVLLSTCIYFLSAYLYIVEPSLFHFTSSTQIQAFVLGFH